MFVDLRKAFDTVNLKILIEKLEHLGVKDDVTLKLFQTYLLNRIQKVNIDGIISDGLITLSGIPQGSVLGPLLFSLYINDVFYLNLNGKIQLYADDMVLIYETSNFESLYEQMQSDLLILSQWLAKNLMLINFDKTNYIIYKNKTKFKNLIANHELRVNNVTINRVLQAKYLGLYIDENLNWEYHIQHVKNTLNSSIFALRKLCNVFSLKAKWDFFNAYIMSHVSYLNPLWNTAAQTKINGIKTLVNRSIKIIKNLPFLTPSVELYSDKLLPLNLYNIYQTILLVYKIQNNIIKHNFEITKMGELHSHNTRRLSYVTINFAHTETGKKDILNYGVNLYNNLPSNIKHELKIGKFKEKLKKHLYDNMN